MNGDYVVTRTEWDPSWPGMLACVWHYETPFGDCVCSFMDWHVFFTIGAMGGQKQAWVTFWNGQTGFAMRTIVWQIDLEAAVDCANLDIVFDYSSSGVLPLGCDWSSIATSTAAVAA